MLYRIRRKDSAPYLTGIWINADGQTQTLRSEQVSLVPQDTAKVVMGSGRAFR